MVREVDESVVVVGYNFEVVVVVVLVVGLMVPQVQVLVLRLLKLLVQTISEHKQWLAMKATNKTVKNVLIYLRFYYYVPFPHRTI